MKLTIPIYNGFKQHLNYFNRRPSSVTFTKHLQQAFRGTQDVRRVHPFLFQRVSSNEFLSRNNRVMSIYLAAQEGKQIKIRVFANPPPSFLQQVSACLKKRVNLSEIRSEVGGYTTAF